MLVIIEERCNEVALKSNTRQISSMKIDAPMNSVHTTSGYADTAGSVAFISSEILSLRICKSAERV
jgi:hypothetical protein